MTGGQLVPVEGPDFPLFALEVCGNSSLYSLLIAILNGGSAAPFMVAILLHVVCNFILLFEQINPEKAREEFRNVTRKDGGTGVKDFMDGMGLGMLVEQVKLYP